jgi:hypothetical protein
MQTRKPFSYGDRVTLVFKGKGGVIRETGVVISTKPLVASILGSHISFNQEGRVLTEGFREGSIMEHALKTDN